MKVKSTAIEGRMMGWEIEDEDGRVLARVQFDMSIATSDQERAMMFVKAAVKRGRMEGQ